MNLFQQGNFTLHSGQKSWLKIDCDALTDSDWETLARMVSCRVGPFYKVEGVPQGGLKLAACLEKYKADKGVLLIVDDVCTTGKSLEVQRAGRNAVGCVVFARHTLPHWCWSLLNLSGEGEWEV